MRSEQIDITATTENRKWTVLEILFRRNARKVMFYSNKDATLSVTTHTHVCQFWLTKIDFSRYCLRRCKLMLRNKYFKETRCTLLSCWIFSGRSFMIVLACCFTISVICGKILALLFVTFVWNAFIYSCCNSFVFNYVVVFSTFRYISLLSFIGVSSAQISVSIIILYVAAFYSCSVASAREKSARVVACRPILVYGIWLEQTWTDLVCVDKDRSTFKSYINYNSRFLVLPLRQGSEESLHAPAHTCMYK